MQTPRHSIATQLALLGLLCYRNIFSINKLSSCRFFPTCSAYAKEAIERYGAWRGGLKAARRLFRCHPLGPWGADPVN